MKKYRLLRQTNYMLKDSPGFVQFIVQKRTGLKWVSIFQSINENSAIEFYGTITTKWPAQVRYELKMKEHMLIVNSRNYSSLGGRIVTEKARIQHKKQFKKALNKAMAETAGRKNPWRQQSLMTILVSEIIDRVKQSKQKSIDKLRDKRIKSMGIDEQREIADRILRKQHEDLRRATADMTNSGLKK